MNTFTDISSICHDKKEKFLIEKTSDDLSKKKKIKKEKSDALMIEYCPKVFQRLRELDEYEGEELYK